MTLSSGIAWLVTWSTVHQMLAYAVLFAGSFFEIFVFSSFFVYGELFFIAGGILASTNVLDIWLVLAMIYGGSLLGDSASYFTGFRLGKDFFKEHKKIFSQKNYEKGLSFFESHGNKAIFFSRFSGPLAWITPFLAGVYKMPYRTFLPYNIAGVVIGVGQFVAIGYFFGFAFMAATKYLKGFAVVSGIMIALVALFYYLRKRRAEKI